ncbi:beta-glucosidase [Mytilus galloprovincialis]|uniref:Beta-glucosidase n=1 Tax=Mytilus galloprovincialis TaxID=29158 RepID=A0A8B6CT60_MYTGA|nr:beta-glucosidase [Mytilus galloprovincialis]
MRSLESLLLFMGGGEVVLLLFTAGPVNITWAEEKKNVVNIFQCFYPAQATGEALLNLFTTVNNSVNPSGRLPYTWYKYANQIPSMVDYSMKEKTYRYFSGEPLYPFGFGLTYTTYNYSNLVVPATVKIGEPVPVQVTVTNTGLFDGDEVVQVYIHWLTTKEPMPNLQLVAVDRVFIQKHTNVTVKLTIDAQSMAVWTDKGFVIEPGSIQVYVGGQLPNQKKTVPSNVLTATFKIVEAKL